MTEKKDYRYSNRQPDRIVTFNRTARYDELRQKLVDIRTKLASATNSEEIDKLNQLLNDTRKEMKIEMMGGMKK